MKLLRRRRYRVPVAEGKPESAGEGCHPDFENTWLLRQSARGLGKVSFEWDRSIGAIEATFLRWRPILVSLNEANFRVSEWL